MFRNIIITMIDFIMAHGLAVGAGAVLLGGVAAVIFVKAYR